MGGDTYTCTCSEGWATTGSSTDEPTCLEQSTVIETSVAVEGAVSQEEFEAAIIAALTPADAAQGAAPVAEVVVTHYETIVTAAAQLPGDAAEYGEGSDKRAALEWGLQHATCGDLPVADCEVIVTGLSRRRRLQQQVRRRLQTISVEFEVTASVDISDSVEPDSLASAFVAAVNSDDAPAGLSGMSAGEFVLPNPPVIATTVEYTVVLVGDGDDGATNMADAAATLADATTITSSLAESTGETITAAPGEVTVPPAPPAPPTPPTSTPSSSPSPPAEAEEESSIGGVILVVLVLAIGGGGAAFYFLVVVPKKSISKADSDDAADKSQFSNPMMDAEDEDELEPEPEPELEPEPAPRLEPED
jgi:hypothetical protein